MTLDELLTVYELLGAGDEPTVERILSKLYPTSDNDERLGNTLNDFVATLEERVRALLNENGATVNSVSWTDDDFIPASASVASASVASATPASSYHHRPADGAVTQEVSRGSH